MKDSKQIYWESSYNNENQESEIILMKKNNILPIFLAIVFLLLGACQKNTFNTSQEPKQVEEKNQDISSSSNGVTIKTDKIQYTKPVEEITVILQNASDDEVKYGNVFYLEKKVNEKWSYLKFNEEFTLEAYTLSSKEKKSKTYSVEALRDKLSPGEYRLVMEIGATPLAAYFKVTE